MYYFFKFIAMLLSPGNSVPLDTVRIDKHISELRELEWFEELYQRPGFHRLFFVRKNLRLYLESPWRTRRLKSSKRAQEKFIDFLHNELKRSSQEK